MAEAIRADWKRRFFTIWAGQALSLVGSALVQFALVWWLTVRTGSASTLATASLVALLPQIVLGPFVGALVDRWNRRLILIVADTSIAVITVVLMVLFATGRVAVWHIYLVMFLRSLGGAFHYPAMASSTSLMVPDTYLARVSGMNQTVQGVISMLSPPLGAMLLEMMPTESVLAIDVATALAAVLPLLWIAVPQPPRYAKPESGPTSYWGELREGLGYVLHWPGLLGVILLAMMLNFWLSPAVSLTPLVVTRVFGKGAVELGWTRTALGSGTIVGGLILSAWGGFKRRMVTSFCGIIGIGLGVILFGMAPAHQFPLLLFASFLQGLSMVFANGPLQAIFQSATAPQVQGRVLSLIDAGAAAMMPLSLLIAGPLADRLGVRFWYALGGSVTILVTLAASFIPAIMNIERHGNGAQGEAEPGG